MKSMCSISTTVSDWLPVAVRISSLVPTWYSGSEPLQFLLENIGQGADAGVEDDVADLAHGFLFHLGQFLERHRLAHHQAHDFQAFILGEHEDGLGLERALVVLADAADALLLGAALPSRRAASARWMKLIDGTDIALPR
jgi:hypothetical protein